MTFNDQSGSGILERRKECPNRIRTAGLKRGAVRRKDHIVNEEGHNQPTLLSAENYLSGKARGTHGAGERLFCLVQVGLISSLGRHR